MIEYFIFIYFSVRQRFVKCYIDQMRHFLTTITSRDEDEHAALKKQLEIFKDDLKNVIDEITLLLTNELHEHLIVINSVKNRISTDFNKTIFNCLKEQITLFALQKILDQYRLLIERSTAIRACSEVFTTIIDLLCSHKIQKRLYDKDVLLLQNVHSH